MRVRFHIHGQGQFDAAHRIGPCVWPHFDLLTIRSGRVWIELLHRDRVELCATQSILIYPHTHFSGASISKCSGAYVQHFALTDVGQMCSDSHPLGRLVNRAKGYELFTPGSSRTLMADIKRAVFMARSRAQTDPHIRQAVLTLVLGQLWAECSPATRRAGTTDPAADFAPVMQWATSHLDRQVTLDDMAHFAGYSTSHFRAQFTRKVGYSPGAFLRQNRHLEAARLLRETQDSIKDIARRVGYDDLAHFYRFFTKIAQLTPRQYRSRHQLRG